MKSVCKMFTRKPTPKLPSLLQSAEDERRRELNRDYEPEEAYGSAHDLRKHIQYGGSIEDY